MLAGAVDNPAHARRHGAVLQSHRRYPGEVHRSLNLTVHQEIVLGTSHWPPIGIGLAMLGRLHRSKALKVGNLADLLSELPIAGHLPERMPANAPVHRCFVIDGRVHVRWNETILRT